MVYIASYTGKEHKMLLGLKRYKYNGSGKKSVYKSNKGNAGKQLITAWFNPGVAYIEVTTTIYRKMYTPPKEQHQVISDLRKAACGST
jgi:hypothetical protein